MSMPGASATTGTPVSSTLTIIDAASSQKTGAGTRDNTNAHSNATSICDGRLRKSGSMSSTREFTIDATRMIPRDVAVFRASTL
jgi:hypothetical protein